MDLFEHQARKHKVGQPLAERMRPETLAHFFGQPHLLGEGKLLRRALQRGELPSLILWGPPGSGKTTLARLLARELRLRFSALSAVGTGVKELRELVAEAARQRDHYGKKTILFVDEIHRFNKAQQDALLPHVEQGTVVLVGATTENPSFEVIAALLSRTRVLRLDPLAEADLIAILRRALAEDARLAALRSQVADQVFTLIARTADGDARRALNTLEVSAALAGEEGAITAEVVAQALQQKTLVYDKGGEEHYNVISAFIKSLRGSDPDAALYWMARMLEAGEDPLFVLRRMVIFAAEDIGNADPLALVVTTSAVAAFQLVGWPEGYLPLSQAATYLATAPKSNTALTAYQAAKQAACDEGPLPVPPHLRNAPTALMRAEGYGKGYLYPHGHAGHFVPQQYLPDALVGRRFYLPSDQGNERRIAERLAAWRKQGSGTDKKP